MDDRNRDDDPRRRSRFRGVFRRILWVFRTCAVNVCSCRFLVSLFILVCSLAMLRLGLNHPESVRNSVENSMDFADFEDGARVGRRNPDIAEATGSMLGGGTEDETCNFTNISTMMSFLDDGTSRECVHRDSNNPGMNCLQCATERFREICEQQTRELQSYSRLRSARLLMDERTSLLSQANREGLFGVTSYATNEDSLLDHFTSSIPVVSKPDGDEKDNKNQCDTWLNVSLASPGVFDGGYISEVTIRGLDYSDEGDTDIPLLEDLRQDASPAASQSTRDASDIKQNESIRPEDLAQVYCEVLSDIRSLINLPYQNQCSNESSARSLESPAKEQDKADQPSPETGAIPKNWDVIRKLSMETESDGQWGSHREQSGSSPSTSHSRNNDYVIPSIHTGAIPKNRGGVRAENDRLSMSGDFFSSSFQRPYSSFEMPPFSKGTNHESPISYTPSRHYTSNILRAAREEYVDLIVISDSDDEVVVEDSSNSD